LAWYVINASYVIREKIANEKPITADRGVPQLFYELVQYWVAFELVKTFTKYGLTPTFNENLNEWSSDLHCIVQLLSKTTQTKEDKERATKCIDTLFDKIEQKTGDTYNKLNLAPNHTSKRCPTLLFRW
jgi:hypothetical protein